MHKARWNFLELKVRLTPVSPLLVKSGGYSANPSLPDMQFVRTFRADLGETIYIPGTSLKGVIRGFSEKILLTADKPVCNPLCKRKSCAGKIDDQASGAEVYRAICPVCKTFGNTRIRGRAVFMDAYPVTEVKTETRYGVAISRQSHAVSAGPFDMEVMVAGDLETRIILENFQLWQAGLLCYALRSMNDGWLKVGFGKNRGLGEIRAVVTSAVISMAKKGQAAGEVWGLAEFVKDSEKQEYGLDGRGDRVSVALPAPADNGLFVEYDLDGEMWRDVETRMVGSLEGFANG